MRVVIAEDAAMMREGLTRLLADRGHDVPAAVADAVWWMFMSGHRLPGQGR
jgi:DNA-binding NarL/FixJ family response regulator